MLKESDVTELIELEVQEYDLINLLHILFNNNEYRQVIVHRPTDARMVYHVEAYKEL